MSVLDERRKEIGNSFMVSALSGSIAGIGQVLSGQPFDIIKVRLQSQSGNAKHYNSAMDCAKSILREEGAFAFYKGTLAPLSGIALCVSVQFGVNQFMKSLVVNMNKASNKSNPEKLTIANYWICGGIAGIVNSFFASPIEHMRIRMQIQSKFHTMAKYTGSYNAVKTIYKNFGIAGVYRGLTSTMIRDAFAYAIFFGTYEVFKEQVPVKNGKKNLALLMALGSVSGVLLWIPTFPIDVVKTRMQTDDLNNPKYKSTLDAIKQIYQKENLKGFTKGIVPCMYRAVVVLAATVGFYEMAHKTIVNIASS